MSARQSVYIFNTYSVYIFNTYKVLDNNQL